MELNEIMRLIWQGLINVPRDAPEREEAIRAYGALGSRLGYTSPELVLVPRPDGYTEVRFKLGEGMIEVPIDIADWADLADEIKKRDSESVYIVNDKMNSIYYNIGDVDAAKRWLTEKAGELNIT